MNVTVVQSPPSDTRNDHYTSNLDPLAPNPLAKLPLGSVRPHGWLGNQLDLMVNGMHGRLEELSPYLKPGNGWEEQPYWLRGFYPLAVLTGNARCLASSNVWIERVFASQDADGYFGAACNKSAGGKSGRSFPDLWPHMVMLDAVILHHESTGDERVVPFMTRFFSFCRELADEQFIPTNVGSEGDWKPTIQHRRAGDMIPHLYWLYSQIREPWLLALAARFYERIKPADDEWLDHHIVHFTQRFQYPGVYHALSRDPRHLALTEYWYSQHMATWGQQPRGIFGADEQIRPGKVDPRQGFETCGSVEFAKSFYLLGRITGNPVYADRTEDIMLNHYPTSHTPDLKALHYLTASNQPQLDCSEQHDHFNKGRQLDYSPHIYRCCQHNAAMGWPWYAQNLWQATSDNGLVAWLYAACEVSATVGDGGEVLIRTRTDYPFDTSVTITFQMSRPCVFPLYLRVPRWCQGFLVKVNGKTLGVRPGPGSYVRIERGWSNGDRIDIEMPMYVSLTTWPRDGSVTVDRGPLSYSVRVEEEWRRCGGTDEWPEWEVLPATPWNYALVLSGQEPLVDSVECGPVGPQPWSVESAPVALKAKARRLPGWQIGADQTIEALPESPVDSVEPEEQITLIPLGCARLRVSCLPVTRHERAPKVTDS